MASRAFERPPPMEQDRPETSPKPRSRGSSPVRHPTSPLASNAVRTRSPPNKTLAAHDHGSRPGAHPATYVEDDVLAAAEADLTIRSLQPDGLEQHRKVHSKVQDQHSPSRFQSGMTPGVRMAKEKLDLHGMVDELRTMHTAMLDLVRLPHSVDDASFKPPAPQSNLEVPRAVPRLRFDRSAGSWTEKFQELISTPSPRVAKSDTATQLPHADRVQVIASTMLQAECRCFVQVSSSLPLSPRRPQTARPAKIERTVAADGAEGRLHFGRAPRPGSRHGVVIGTQQTEEEPTAKTAQRPFTAKVPGPHGSLCKGTTVLQPSSGRSTPVKPDTLTVRAATPPTWASGTTHSSGSTLADGHPTSNADTEKKPDSQPSETAANPGQWSSHLIKFQDGLIDRLKASQLSQRPAQPQRLNKCCPTDLRSEVKVLEDRRAKKWRENMKEPSPPSDVHSSATISMIADPTQPLSAADTEVASPEGFGTTAPQGLISGSAVKISPRALVGKTKARLRKSN